MALPRSLAIGEMRLSQDGTEATFGGKRTYNLAGNYTVVERRVLKVRDEYAEWWEYTVQQGDVMHDLAGSFLGSPDRYWELYYMNPQLISNVKPDEWRTLGYSRGVDYIKPGEKLFFSRNLISPRRRKLPNVRPDDLTVFIGGQLMPRPHRFSFEEFYDTICDSFEMVYPFDPFSETDRAIFQPLRLRPCEIYIGENLVCYGIIEAIANTAKPDEVSVTVAGRTRSYILQKTDINPFIEVIHRNMKVADIAKKICTSCGLVLEIDQDSNDSETNRMFDKFAFERNENCFDVLTRAAKQRRLIAGHDVDGAIILKRAKRDKPPIASILMGQSLNQNAGDKSRINVQDCEVRYDTTEMFATYVGLTQINGYNGVLIAAGYKNPLIKNERSLKYNEFHDIGKTELLTVTKWESTKAVREFFNGTIEMENWLIPGTDNRWRTGDVVEFEAPSLQIYKPHKMLIKMIRFEWTSERKTARLNIVPIETFTGDEIADVPWAYDGQVASAVQPTGLQFGRRN